MELPLNVLREHVESFLSQLGGRRYRLAAGLSTGLELSGPYREHAVLAHPETFLAVQERSGHPRTDERERVALGRVRMFLADFAEDARAAEAAEESWTFESQAQLPLDEESCGFLDGMSRLPFEENRRRREELERAAADLLASHQGPYARRIEAAHASARALGYGSALARHEALSPGVAALADQAEGVLRRTEDAYRDLLAYALKRGDPAVKPLPGGDAARHDLQRAMLAPWLLHHFAEADLIPAAQRWVADLGFHPHAEGRICLTTERADGRLSAAVLAPLKVPDELRLVLRPRGGLDDCGATLAELLRAQFLAHISRRAPVEERWLGDGALGASYALLGEHLLLDEAWHRRYLRGPAGPSREAARMAAFVSCARLRQSCAQLQWELGLLARGPTPEVLEEYEERLSAAMGVRFRRGFALRDFEPRLSGLVGLRARALEARLHGVLRDRFNEDYWRNPGAGSFLRQLFSRGTRQSAEELASELGGELSFASATDRVVGVMGA